MIISFMTTESSQGKANTFITLVGVILLLLGIFGTVRTAVNLLAFSKYPTTGIFTINITGIPPYYQREEDCMFPQTYYTQDGKPRGSTTEEQAQSKEQQRICLTGIRDSREATKTNDISTSLLFLFLGVGILSTKRFFFK